jgi:hypothetical protein
MPGFMKGVGHASAALLIQLQTAHLAVAATLCILRLGRLRLRGPRGAQDEFILAAIAQNLRRFAALVARPPPAEVLRTA